MAAMSVPARIELGWSQLMHHIEVAGAADDDDTCEKGEAKLAHRLQ